MPFLKRLRGITWNHTRGFLPMVATAQRYSETHPGVEIVWEKRSLQAFADEPLDVLAGRFDLLVIDHPHVGAAARGEMLLPLDEHLPTELLRSQAEGQVGRSHESYRYGGHQWALAIDAATPVASWIRGDFDVPGTWSELLQLAKAGMVVVPALAIDSLMNWYSLCIDWDSTLFQTPGCLVNPTTGEQALECLRELVTLCSPACLWRNPIAVYEALCDSHDPAKYCPFAFGYSNYAQEGYASACLEFGSPPSGPSGKALRTTLGGTGLAISAGCFEREIALDYAQFVARPETQRGIYVRSGGQPGHRDAWTDRDANDGTGQYFNRTLPVVDRAYLRPRYSGYMEFQDAACLVVHRALLGETPVPEAIRVMDELYRRSLRDCTEL